MYFNTRQILKPVTAQTTAIPVAKYFVLWDTEMPFDEDVTPLFQGTYKECEKFVSKTPHSKMWFITADMDSMLTVARH